MIKTLGAIFSLELMIVWRRAQQWLYPLAFFMMTCCLFPLVFTPDEARLSDLLPGGIWLNALLASILATQTMLDGDLEDNHLEQVCLSDLPLSLLLLIKFSVQWLLTQAPIILMTPILGLLFHLSSLTIAILCLSLMLGTPLFTLIGCLVSALTLSLRQPGALLGLLILPLCTPILIFGVNMVQQAQMGLAIIGPLTFLAGLSLAALTLLPWAIAGILRMHLAD